MGYLPCELAMVKAQGLTEIIEPSAFDMIYACNIQPAAITVSADSEWDSIEDLVAWCKEHPRRAPGRHLRHRFCVAYRC